jgi:hypothetical protein
MVVGRYVKAGTFRMTLRGTHAVQEVTVAQDVTLPETRTESAAVPYLWGARKVADLLDRIRRQGKNAELVADVIRLSREYRVATPYTSFLVLEDEAAYDREGIDRRAPDAISNRPVADHNEAGDNEELDQTTGDNEDLISDKRLKDQGVHGAIGVGGGAGGVYGGGRFGGRRTLVARGGGGCVSESAASASIGSQVQSAGCGSRRTSWYRSAAGRSVIRPDTNAPSTWAMWNSQKDPSRM